MSIKKALRERNLSFVNIISASDIYTIAVFLIYIVLTLSCFRDFSNSWELIGINIGFILIVVAVAYLETKYKCKYLTLFRTLYIAGIVYFVYLHTQIYIKVINPYYFDNLLKYLDHFIFSVNPTEWLSHLSNPFLTEYFQICYFMFFFMPVVHGIELYYRKRDQELSELMRQIVFGFYFSYLLYFMLPAIGPRFSVHNFFTISNELPGLFFTEKIRAFVNNGGGIPPGAINPANWVNRDCMPSGHTMLTLINIIMAAKFKSKFRYVFYVIGGSLIFATLYLRYHYVVDVIAGAACAFLSYKLEPKIFRFLSKKGISK